MTGTGLRKNKVLLNGEVDARDLVAIDRESHWSPIEVGSSAPIRVEFEVSGSGNELDRAAILLVRFKDEDGKKVGGRGLYYQSAEKQSFLYLHYKGDGVYSVVLPQPDESRRIEFALRLWGSKAPSLNVVNTVAAVASTTATRYPEFQWLPAPDFTSASRLIADGPVVFFAGPEEISITDDPRWFDFELTTARYLKLEVQLQSPEPPNPRAVVAKIEFFDDFGAPVEPGDWANTSALVGRYFYLGTADTGATNRYVLVPETASRMRLGLQKWHVNDVALHQQGRIDAVGRQELSRGLGISIEGTRKMRDIRVALIADEFTFNSFRFECDAIALDPTDWKKQMEEFKPDLFFCESAWSGADSVSRPWKGRIYASVNFERENRRHLLDIIAYCRENRIRSVFWNKEDPTHFEDRVHDFVETSTEFDIVFTTAEECVDRYRSEHGVKNISVLPFATQPRLFNPIASGPRDEGVIFAGSWYANHEQRCTDMAAMFETVLSAGLPLVIYDRFYGTDDILHRFPDKYLRYCRPPVSHKDMASVYKTTSIGININTVIDSETMFARRAFELASSNTLIFSNPAFGMQKFFDGAILSLDDGAPSNVLNELEPTRLGNLRDRALTSVLTHHTYRHRLERILQVAGIDYVAKTRAAVLTVVVRTAEEASDVISAGGHLGQRVSSILLIIAREVPAIDAAALYVEFNRFNVRVLSLYAWEKYDISNDTLQEDGDLLVVDASRLQELDADVFDRLLLHREYIDDVITLAPSAASRFTFIGRTSPHLALLPANRLDSSIFTHETFGGTIYLV